MNKVKFVCNALLRLLNKDLNRRDLNKPVTVYSRNSVVLSDFVDQVFNIYDGHKFLLVRVTPNMVGFTFGDFALSKLMTGAIHSSGKGKVKGKQQNVKKGNVQKKK